MTDDRSEKMNRRNRGSVLRQGKDGNASRASAQKQRTIGQQNKAGEDDRVASQRVGSVNDLHEASIEIASSALNAPKMDPDAVRAPSTSNVSQPSLNQVTPLRQEKGRVRYAITYQNEKELYYPDSDQVSIGRDEANELRLVDQKVSRFHARIEPVMGAHRIVDLGAGNGIRINGRKRRSAVLVHGDKVHLGDTEIIFQQVGYVNQPSRTNWDTGLDDWRRVVDLLNKREKLRLSIFAASLAFLTSASIFLIMSLVDRPETLTTEQHINRFRHEAEKRALNGEYEAALRSIDKVQFLIETLTEEDVNRRTKWTQKRAAKAIARQIQLKTLGDPNPAALEPLLAALSNHPFLRSVAATQIEDAKLNFLERALTARKISSSKRTLLIEVFESLDKETLDGERYKRISKRLLRK